MGENKTRRIASTLAIGALAFSSAGGAKSDGHDPVEAFGPVYEMKFCDHMMHVQQTEDKTGGQWVVMSRAEFEKMAGVSLGKYKFTMMP